MGLNVVNSSSLSSSLSPVAPRPGDRFTYQGTFWVHVIAVLGPYVVAEEYGGLPCIAPDDARLRIFKSVEHFRETYASPGSNRLWIQYVDNDAPLHHVQFSESLLPSAGFHDHHPQPIEADAPDLLYQMLAEHVLVTTDATGSAIALATHNGIVCRASRGWTAPQPGMWLMDQSGLLAECLHTDRPLRCDDTEAAEMLGLGAFRRADISSVLLAPLRRARGLILAFSTERYAFGARDMAAVCISSEILSVVLDGTPMRDLPAFAGPSRLAALA
jgi:hypothetical protein